MGARQPAQTGSAETGPGRNRSARLLAVVVSLVSASGCLGADPRPPGSAAPSPTGPLERRDFGGVQADVHGEDRIDTGNATVLLRDRYFEPNVLSGPAGLDVSLMVRNEGTQMHNLSAPTLAVSQDVPPGQIVAVQVSLPTSGETVFFCRFHRDAGMVGALVAS